MMKTSPPAAFVVAEAQFLLEIPVVALDAPAQLGGVDERFDWHIRRQGREPVFGRLGLALGPLDQQPFLGMRLGALPVP